MYTKKTNKGFTLVEIMVSIVIMGIILAISASSGSYLYRDYKYSDYVSKVEYLSKYAKIYSVKNAVYTGLCVNGKTLTLANFGAKVSGDPCSVAFTPITTVKITEKYISVKPVTTSNTKNFIIDPRGIATSNITDATNINNNTSALCLSNGNKSNIFLVSETGLLQKGISVCP